MKRACLNLSGVSMRKKHPRAMMRVAPDDPKNGSSLEDLFSEQGFHQAVVPFTSSNFSVAKPVGLVVTAKEESRCAQAGMPVPSTLNVALFLTNAQAIRASLLASAQATTFECRRDSIPPTHSASLPETRTVTHSAPARGGSLISGL